MGRTPDEINSNTILRKLIKARKSQMVRLQLEIQELEMLADQEDAKNRAKRE